MGREVSALYSKSICQVCVYRGQLTNKHGRLPFRYGNNGYEMINVTYAGDTLIAYKVTGDKNVPRGEITFQADLTPNAVRQLRNGDFIGNKVSKAPDRSQKSLEPIMLTEKAATKWGTRQLPRYKGLGQVAEPGFINHKWMDGQLIIIGEEYFSFAWVVSTCCRLVVCVLSCVLFSTCSLHSFLYQTATGKPNFLWAPFPRAGSKNAARRRKGGLANPIPLGGPAVVGR